MEPKFYNGIEDKLYTMMKGKETINGVNETVEDVSTFLYWRL